MRERKEMHFHVDGGTATVMSNAAKRLGFVSQTGRTFGRGSVTQLLRGLASGQVDPRRLDRAIEEERKLVRLEEEDDHE